MNLYDISVRDVNGKLVSLKEYEGKTLLIVNTALDCGFAPQYTELELLYRKYKDQGFVILDFPCNQFANQSPLEDVENAHACQLRYETSFPIFAKVKVNGEDADPLYVYLKQKKSGLLGSVIKWNFTKFLINNKGEVLERYSPNTTPLSFEDDIKKTLDL